MISNRQTSQHKIDNKLYQSLKKQRELSNRINALLIEKEKNIKNIQRRIIQNHHLHQNRIEKTLRRQELNQSFENSKRTEIYKSQVFKELKSQLSNTIIKKQTQLKSTKQEWYKSMKKQQKQNQKKIQRCKLRQLQGKKNSKNQVKLTEICIKQNIRKYWDERLNFIQDCKQKDNQLKNKLLETSLNNISILQEKEKSLLSQLKRSHEYESRLKNDDYDVIFVQQKPLVSWRTPQTEQ